MIESGRASNSIGENAMVTSVIGRRLPKVDGVEKVTGKSLFGADVVVPGMLYAKIVHSPYAHARIKRIDKTKALALPGVKAVITAADFPQMAPGTASFNMGENEISLIDMSRLMMAGDKARFHGQSVAAVAATSPYIADQAAALVEIEWEVLEPVLDPERAMEADAPLVHEDLFTQSLGKGKAEKPSNVATEVVMANGDVAAGFAEADVVIEKRYTFNGAHQGYIEPHACLADVTTDGQLRVWTSTQGAFTIQMQLAAFLQMPLSKITVVPSECGGAFGGKIYSLFEPIAALLALTTRKPVKLVISREEVIRQTGPGAAGVAYLKMGAKKDGTITAASGRFIGEAGAFAGSPVTAMVNCGGSCYRIPNFDLTAYDVVVNKQRVSAYRGPGTPQAAFVWEQHIDQLAEAIGMDPLEFRLKNAVDEGDTMVVGAPFNRIGLREILNRLKAHPCWTDPVTLAKEGGKVGRGMALGFWRGATMTSSAQVVVNGDGTVAVTVGSVDLSGTRTSLLQIVAEEFGLEPDQVKIHTGDTDSVGYTDLAGGSRIVYTMGNALHRACREAIAQLKERAGQRLEADPEDIELAEGQLRVKGSPDKALAFKTLARNSIGTGPIIGRGTSTRLKDAPTFAAHVADVEVDEDTGKVQIRRYTTFQDCGRAINPTMVEGQMQGGATQGIGWALTEDYLYDDQGVIRNASLLDYRMPTALDLPMLDTEIIEVPASDGPYGARGTGEVPIAPPTGALANAIANAVGVRPSHAPMTPERVFGWLAEKG
jgi:CO/xanthine dehydrogenase Mo-binding subunit